MHGRAHGRDLVIFKFHTPTFPGLNAYIYLLYPPDIEEHQHVEHGQTGEGQRVHEDQIHPGDVDADVDRVLPHGRGHDVRLARDLVHVPRDLEEAGQVVADGEAEDHQDGHFGAAVSYEIRRSKHEKDFIFDVRSTFIYIQFHAIQSSQLSLLIIA